MMKKHLFWMALVALSFAFVSSGPALADDNTFTDNDLNDSYWDTAANWSKGRKPDNTDNVIIGNGKTCKLRTTGGNGRAKTLEIQSGGTLEMLDNSTLIIGTNNTALTSTIDGTLKIGLESGDQSGTLEIKGDHTVEGDNGTINMWKNSVIKSNNDSTNDKLTLKKTGAGSGRNDSITIIGAGTVSVQLVNGGYVIASIPTGGIGSQLSMTTYDKSGNSDGHWQALSADVLLFSSCDVTGGGEWRIDDVDCTDDCGGTIEIDSSACVAVTGNVIFKTGELICKGDFCTTGSLTWQSVEDTDEVNTAPKVRTAANTTVSFSTASCSCS